MIYKKGAGLFIHTGTDDVAQKMEAMSLSGEGKNRKKIQLASCWL